MSAYRENFFSSEYSVGINNAKEEQTLTPIQEFYKGKNIFITGATGFLGKLVLEKLLWSCPGIGNIYLLMRNKKGIDVQSRIKELINSQAFVRVKRDVSGFEQKIKPLAGDCALPGLGLDEEDKQMIIKEVNIIFHVAATVKFNEPLPYAAAVNIRATMDIVKLAKQMEKLESFIHLSTAFTNCYMTELEEKFYGAPMDPENLLHFTESCDPNILDDITPKLLNKWPNTYTLTKCLAEEYIRRGALNIPVGVFRPSLVIPSITEPVPGWIDNWYGISGYITAVSVGIMRICRVNVKTNPNIVPVDYCVNGIIAAGWDVARKFSQTTRIEEMSLNNNNNNNSIQIYNFVLGDKKTTWQEMYDRTSHYGKQHPPMQALWYRYFTSQSIEPLFQVQRFLMHDMPAYIADAVCFCMGKKMMFRSLYKKIHTLDDSVAFFTKQNWFFTNHNIPKLIESMTEQDQKLYSCNMNTLQWEEFFKIFFLGTRRYLLKEDDSTIPAAKKRYFRLYILHRLFQAVILYCLIKAVYKTFNFVAHLSN